jgi:predicted component of type VI protein secretion system
MTKLTCCAVLAVLAGCSTTPNYDKHFGDAVRQARLAMTINPNASDNPDQVAGIDGKAAGESITRYQDSFKAPPPVVNVINIGGVAGNAK